MQLQRYGRTSGVGHRPQPRHEPRHIGRRTGQCQFIHTPVQQFVGHAGHRPAAGGHHAVDRCLVRLDQVVLPITHEAAEHPAPEQTPVAQPHAGFAPRGLRIVSHMPRNEIREPEIRVAAPELPQVVLHPADALAADRGRQVGQHHAIRVARCHAQHLGLVGGDQHRRPGRSGPGRVVVLHGVAPARVAERRARCDALQDGDALPHRPHPAFGPDAERLQGLAASPDHDPRPPPGILVEREQARGDAHRVGVEGIDRDGAQADAPGCLGCRNQVAPRIAGGQVTGGPQGVDATGLGECCQPGDFLRWQQGIDDDLDVHRASRCIPAPRAAALSKVAVCTQSQAPPIRSIRQSAKSHFPAR